MRHWILMLLTIVLAHSVAFAGSVLTREGKTLVGEVSLADGAVVVTPEKGPATRVALADVARARFAEPAGPNVEYGHARREKTKATGGRVLAEYFSDRECTDRRLARYEPTIVTYLDAKTSPDPAVPLKCTARYTARVMPKATQKCTFLLEAHGPVRFWVDGVLKVDQWGARGPGKYDSGPVQLTADKAVAVRVEVGGTEHGLLVRLGWAGEGIRTPYIPEEAYELPEGATAPPEVALVSPAEDVHVRNPKVLTFEARAEAAAGRKIVAAAVIADKAVVASAGEVGPYKLEWAEPPPGVYRVKVRATDDRGISAYSESVDVSVADAGEKESLPAPWGQQTLGKKEARVTGAASFADGVFRISKAGGQITEDDDSSQFVYQPVAGDFEIVARLASLTPDSNQVGPLAGIMVRENMTGRDRILAAVVGPGATQIARRPDYWGRTVAGDRIEQAASWLKVVRHANRLRAYTSLDGKAWSLLGAERIELPERVFVGICAMSRDKERAAEAVFDHVAVTPGPPALVHSAEGVLFRSGTFLAAEVGGIRDGKVAYTRGGKRLTRPADEVARLVYKAVPTELAEKVPAGGVGVLLGSGDFVEGELKEISYRVTVSNVLFGPRTFGIKTSDVLAIYLRDVEEGKTPWVVTVTDGSVYQANALKLTGDRLAVEDVTLGVVEVGVKELAEVRVR